jgi:hypothetical protein
MYMTVLADGTLLLHDSPSGNERNANRDFEDVPTWSADQLTCPNLIGCV